MKPLSIEELKNLIIGTWVYLTDKDGYLGRYVVKAEAPIEEDDKTFNFDSLFISVISLLNFLPVSM